ncbi:MAG: ATP-binding cassette domain-containing protein [Candidatus Heimdallarchaeota archaeon]|nr:ATP-binding cassette domain-containing protein [Candidatus Heimdallarchaeota archaeon]MBY8995435.1 ATP-binding cassette domain-containing protein [Candidatus Heimdallarchaeota archaeon]
MIEIVKVNFRYLNSKKSILQDFSLEISKGEILGIIGPTGSGKSTICYLFNGLIPHTIKGNFSGSVIINGKNTVDSSVEEMSEKIGYILQEPSFQIASPHVESEITFGMENLGLSIEEMDQKLNKILEKLSITHLRYRQTANLSEGEKQKVILASILTMEPGILVLDESSSMVDTTSKTNLIQTLRELNQEEQKTIVIIDHDLDLIAQIATRILLINEGRIIADGQPQDILTDVKLLRENGLIPTSITSLFHELKENELPVKKLPLSFSEATKILEEWLS